MHLIVNNALNSSESESLINDGHNNVHFKIYCETQETQWKCLLVYNVSCEYKT